MFRVLITGSRDWDDPERIWYHLSKLDRKLASRPATLVHGDAPHGADRMAGSHWLSLATDDRLREVEVHPAKWESLGKRAGMVRNTEMIRLGANLCLAFIKGGSPGASHCANLAEKKGIRTIRFIA